MSWVVSIDGPAASGKSSVSREIAKRMGISWVSTGAFYRGLAYVALRKGLDLDDVAGLTQLAKSNEWRVEMHADKTKILIDHEDVTDHINHEDVGNFASRISAFPDVREALLEGQRNCFKNDKPLLAEGRDCGTVVFPQSILKVYLTASSENRAARRALEKGLDAIHTQKVQAIRDRQDSSRTSAPLQVAEGALVIDTTHLTLNEVANQIELELRTRIKKLSI